VSTKLEKKYDDQVKQAKVYLDGLKGVLSRKRE